jgi:hypothetical protein
VVQLRLPSRWPSRRVSATLSAVVSILLIVAVALDRQGSQCQDDQRTEILHKQFIASSGMTAFVTMWGTQFMTRPTSEKELERWQKTAEIAAQHAQETQANFSRALSDQRCRVWTDWGSVALICAFILSLFVISAALPSTA